MSGRCRRQVGVTRSRRGHNAPGRPSASRRLPCRPMCSSHAGGNENLATYSQNWFRLWKSADSIGAHDLRGPHGLRDAPKK